MNGRVTRPLLRRGGLSGQVFVITRYRPDARDPARVVALTKHDVTQDFLTIVAEMFPTLVEQGALRPKEGG